MRLRFPAFAVLFLAAAAVPGAAMAQINVDPNLLPKKKELMPDLKPIPEPTQRLEPGAILCNSEATLQLHAAALAARLDGRPAGEPPGCRLIRTRTAVAVLTRRGPGKTEVRLPGPPPETGWTDTLIADR